MGEEMIMTDYADVSIVVSEKGIMHLRVDGKSTPIVVKDVDNSTGVISLECRTQFVQFSNRSPEMPRKLLSRT